LKASNGPAAGAGGDGVVLLLMTCEAAAATFAAAAAAARWEGWEKKLAYYDRTYGELMNEW
jgi:hypothetical protein